MCTSVRVVRYHTCPPFCPSGKAAECEQQSGHFSKQRSRKLENTAIFFVAGSRVGPKAGATVWDYMMEQVKPQHSFSSVRPVLVRGEEVCWALDRGRLVGTPQIQQRKNPSKPRYTIEVKGIFLDASMANSASKTTSKISSQRIPVFIFLGNLEFRKSAISLSSSFSLQKKITNSTKTKNKQHKIPGLQRLLLSLDETSVKCALNGTTR